MPNLGRREKAMQGGRVESELHTLRRNLRLRLHLCLDQSEHCFRCLSAHARQYVLQTLIKEKGLAASLSAGSYFPRRLYVSRHAFPRFQERLGPHRRVVRRRRRLERVEEDEEEATFWRRSRKEEGEGRVWRCGKK